MRERAILLTHCSQLLTLRGNLAPRRGGAMRELGIIEDGAVLIENGKIAAVGSTDEPWVRGKDVDEIDCRDKVALPGFVDSHTHPVFVQPRLVDFEKRIAGASYEEIAEAGGGIRSSIDAVRKAGKPLLAENVLAAFHEMASLGTTTVEAKSGYGLNVESELKSLEAIREAAKKWPGTVVPTLLGAHVVPAEHRHKPEKYVEEICGRMIPLAAKKRLARFVDVFTERGAFSLEDTERV